MVHALKEAWRVLKRDGTMLDIRPLSIDVPMEVQFDGGGESAGMIDLSPDIECDIASDQAVETVIKEQIFQEKKTEFFDFAYYWKTLKAMRADLDEFWKDDVVIPQEIWRNAREILKKRQPEVRIRVGLRMKLSAYMKRV